MLVKLKDARQPVLGLLERVEAFEVLREVIEDQVLFKDGDDVALLVVHDVCCYLRVVVFLRGQVLRIKRLLSKKLPVIVLIGLHKEDLSAH